jgi:glycerol kinase
VWDREGKPLANAVVWQCKRPVAICGRLKEQGVEQEIHQRTGLIIDPYFSGTKVMWLYENNDLVRRAVDTGNACFGTVDTWLLYRLTGGKQYRSDYTNACRTLFFNINDLSWDQTLLDTLGLGGLVLPEVQGSASSFGRTDFEATLASPVEIGAMIGDSHASAFGQACFEPGAAKVTMGTGSSILMNTGSQRKKSSTGMVETICFSTGDRVDYALEGIIVSCGATLTWLKDQLGLYSDVSELEPAAESLVSSDGVYLIPAFAGMGAPHWKMDARAVMAGLTFGSTRNHVMRAALESIPYQIADIICSMEADSGIKLRELVADGGISKNGFVMRLCADLLEASVVQRGIEEVSALGAATLAGLHKGIFPDLNAVKALESNPATYMPREDRAAAQTAYQGWRQAVGLLSK